MTCNNKCNQGRDCTCTDCEDDYIKMVKDATQGVIIFVLIAAFAVGLFISWWG